MSINPASLSLGTVKGNSDAVQQQPEIALTKIALIEPPEQKPDRQVREIDTAIGVLLLWTERTNVFRNLNPRKVKILQDTFKEIEELRQLDPEYINSQKTQELRILQASFDVHLKLSKLNKKYKLRKKSS